MLDFGHHRWTARNVLARSQQQRPLLATMAAGLVVAMVFWVAEPGHAGGRRAAIDTRLPRHDSHEPLLVAQKPGQDPNPRQSQAGSAELAAGLLQKAPMGRGELLATIHDDTPLESDELPALFELLKLLRDPQTSAGAAPTVPAYIQLFEQPKVFRGQLVTVRGRVHRAVPVTVAEKGHPATELVQLWLEPRDDQPNPIVIDCTQLPKAFPRGLVIDEQVEVTGFYFKRLAYTDQEHNTRLAPMIVAQVARWFPHRPVIRKRMNWKQLAAGATVALVAAVVLLMLALPRRRGSIWLSEPPTSSRNPVTGFDRLDALRNLQVSAESREALERIAKTGRAEQKGPP